MAPFPRSRLSQPAHLRGLGWFTSILALSIFSAPFFAAEATADLTVTAENVGTFYRSFPRLTDQPHQAGVELLMLCNAPNNASADRSARYGPHRESMVHYYANSVAREILPLKAGSFPKGAVIVKEKLAADGSVRAIGGMIKRASGFNPEGGDWEYFYFEKRSGFAGGRLENCAACHAEAKKSDYVFASRAFLSNRKATSP